MCYKNEYFYYYSRSFWNIQEIRESCFIVLEILCNKERMRYDIKNVDIEEVSFINRTIISLNVGTE